MEHIRTLVAEKVSNTGISREICVDVLTLQTHEMDLRAKAAMDAFIERFYEKHLHPDLFHPQNLRLVARYMLSNGFDAHTRAEDTTDYASQPLTAPRSTYEGMKAAGLLGLLGKHVRLSKLTVAASQDSLGRGLVVSHFANSLLQDALICGLKVYLTECPHLRTVFGKSRLPRAALIMPALQVSCISQPWDALLMFWCHQTTDYWRKRETGYFRALEEDAAYRARKDSITYLMDFIRDTDEGKGLGKKLFKITSLMFLEPMDELPA